MFEPGTLESQSTAHKAQILAYFPIKTWVKYFHPVVWTNGQITFRSKNGQKHSPLMTSPATKHNPKIFFQCRLTYLLNPLRV